MVSLKKARLNIMKPPQKHTVLLVKNNITIKVSSFGLARELINNGWNKV